MLPESKSNGLENRPDVGEYGEEYQDVGEMGFGSHASVSVDGEMETLSSIYVWADIVHCFSGLFTPISSNYQPPIMAAPWNS